MSAGFGMRAQGAVEYLMIIGVVLIIALMVISVLGFFPSTAGESVASQSQLYWRGQAKPYSIIEVAYLNQTPCNSSGNYTGLIMMMKNGEKYSLTLKNIYINDVIYSVCPYGNATGSLQFSPGEEQIVGVELPGSEAVCHDRSSDSLKLDLRYDSPYITNKLESGSINLYVPCR